MPDPAFTDRPDLDRTGHDDTPESQPSDDSPELRPADDTVESRSSDDTVEHHAEPTLADDLLSSDHPAEDGDVIRGGAEGEVGRDERGDLEQGQSAEARTSAGLPSRATDSTGPDEDDEYFEPHDQRRSRLTTGLLVALIFALGVLTGVLVGRLLTPTPAPQIVYVLDDASASAPVPSARVPAAPTPVASR